MAGKSDIYYPERLQFRASAALVQAVDEYAELAHCPLSEALRRLLVDGLKSHGVAVGRRHLAKA